MTAATNALPTDERRFPWTYALLELVPVAGWLGMVGAFLGWRVLMAIDGETSELPPVVEEAVVLVAIVFLLLFIPLLFASMAAILFGYGVGWIASGRVYIGIVTGVPRGALTLLVLKIATSGDDTGFTEPAMLAVFAQLAVLSIISAAALWSAESTRRRDLREVRV